MKKLLGVILLFHILPAGFSPGQDILPFEPDDTLEEIRYKIDHNGYSFQVADNWVFRMSPEEKSRFFSRRFPLHPAEATRGLNIGPLSRKFGKQIPSSFDWRDYNGHAYIGPVRNQGSCGACYAFGACAAAEGTYNKANVLYDADCVDFSESYIIWCLGRLPAYSSHFFGCGGADWDYAELDALCLEGICVEADFPYTETDPGSCTHWGDQTYVFQDWYRINCLKIDAIKTAISTYGPVDAAVYVQGAFQGYSGGIYEDSYTTCPPDPQIGPECYHSYTNHAIALVGWDDNYEWNGQTAGVWILRNSWGNGWGDNGYMYIKYTSARVACEACYLVYQPPATPTPTPVGFHTPSPSPTASETIPSPTPTPSTSCDYQVSGGVYDRDTTDPIPDAEVWLEFSDHEIYGAFTSSSDGYYSIWTCIPRAPGEVLVWASHPDYITGNGATTWGCYAHRGVDIELDRISPPSPTPTCSPNISQPGFLITGGDYDGDGRSDPAVFRDSAGLWAIRGVTRVYYGSIDDSPVSGDYNGDGTTDIAIFRPSGGVWAIRGISRVYYGSAIEFPCPADYDGDGSADIAVFRAESGRWAIRGITRVYFGGDNDRPIPGDYTGSGTANIAIFRPSSGLWAVRDISRVYFGETNDWPLPADYDGDGTSDIGIFRPGSGGLWAVRDLTRVYYGSCLDWPVPADYRGEGIDHIGIFRETSGLWAIKGVTRAYFGSSVDIPVTR